ncbi:MAG: hypothetical protein H0U08_10630, partial [Actinobacteria bacterium]|nr:hypothetical protein [Actinomycetota bacterium]
LAALRPELLDQIVRQAISPYFDTSLERRVREARNEWLEEAQAWLEEQLDQVELDRIRTEAGVKLEQLRDEIDAINDALHIDIGAIGLPEIVVPRPELNGSGNGSPLIDSDWSWVEQTTRLKESKSY